MSLPVVFEGLGILRRSALLFSQAILPAAGSFHRELRRVLKSALHYSQSAAIARRSEEDTLLSSLTSPEAGAHLVPSFIGPREDAR